MGHWGGGKVYRRKSRQEPQVQRWNFLVCPGTINWAIIHVDVMRTETTIILVTNADCLKRTRKKKTLKLLWNKKKRIMQLSTKKNNRLQDASSKWVLSRSNASGWLKFTLLLLTLSCSLQRSQRDPEESRQCE